MERETSIFTRRSNGCGRSLSIFNNPSSRSPYITGDGNFNIR